jgi:hypothetical protein
LRTRQTFDAGGRGQIANEPLATTIIAIATQIDDATIATWTTIWAAVTTGAAATRCWAGEHPYRHQGQQGQAGVHGHVHGVRVLVAPIKRGCLDDPACVTGLLAPAQRMATVDVVVIGTEPTALLASLALRKAGRSVVIIAEGGRGQPLGDRLLPTAAHLWSPPVAGPLSSLLSSLGAEESIRAALGPLGGLGIIDDPDHRLVLLPQAVDRDRELTRCFGPSSITTSDALNRARSDGADAVAAELAHLDEDGFLLGARRFAKRAQPSIAAMIAAADETTRWFSNTPLAIVIEQLAPMLCHADGTQADARAAATLMAMRCLQAGVPLASKGGLGPRQALVRALRESAEAAGVKVVRGPVQRVVVLKKTVVEVQAGEASFTPSVVIDGSSHGMWSKCVWRDGTPCPLSAKQEGERRLMTRASTSLQRVSVRWLVSTDALPRGIPPLSLVLRPPPQVPVLVGLYMGRPMQSDGDDPTLSTSKPTQRMDSNRIGVVATTTATLSRTEETTAMLHQLLDGLLPFVRSQSPVSDELSGADIDEWSAVETGQGAHPLSGQWPRTRYNNAWRASRKLAPGFGLDGELLSAQSVVTMAQLSLRDRDAKKPAPLRTLPG